MDKSKFLRALEARISMLPKHEIDERLDYYAELISDMTEDGMSEREAIERLGGVDKVAADILCEQPLSALMRSRVRPQNGWTALSITLVILGSPVWLPVLLSVAAALFAIIISLVSVVIALYAGLLGIAAGAVGGGVMGFVLLIKQGFVEGMAYIGGALILAGVGMLAFKLLNHCARKFWAWLRRALPMSFRRLKALFIRKNGRYE